ncbi:LLM class flavin-dependent oxidoreductase [Kribbella sp. NBC_01505]|uniref:LLM class flavin-dependent oxidoreductase n=1 Tax=Kribbella sp. NBC_01505 TaxID=2903580 RepID=UPI0038686569
MSPLAVGVVLPSLRTQHEQHLDLREAARYAEKAGLASVWHGDHLAVGGPVLDVTVGLATAAAVTETISIGASVFVPALRSLAWAAKQIGSLQQVSGGRLILGIGSGGGSAQWAAAEIPYADRGPRTDRALELLPALLAGAPTLIGEQEVTLAPAVSRPPFWVGNASKVALRRAAGLGDGWFPSLVKPADVAAGRSWLAGQTDRPMTVAVGATGALGHQVKTAAELEAAISSGYGIPATGVPITGSPAQAAERLAEFQQAGAGHLVMGFADGDWREQCDLLAAAVSLAGG